MKDSLIEKGDQLLKDGDIQAALDCYFKYNWNNTPTAEVFMKIGHCNKILQDNENAIDYYKKALELEPGHIETLYNCGDAMFLFNQLEDAIEMFEKVIEIASEKGGDIVSLAESKRDEAKSTLLNREGGALMKENRLDEAYDVFMQAIDLNPADRRNYANIAVIFLKQGQTDEAIEWMKKALAIDPEYVRGYYNLGTIYYKKGGYQQAVILLSKGLEIEPDGRDSTDISTNLEAAREQLEASKTELLSYINGENIQVSNDRILELANAVADEKIIYVDTAILKNNKMKFVAHATENIYEISESEGELIIEKTN